MIAAKAKVAPCVVFDPPISAADLAEACGVEVGAILAKCCTHGWDCRRIGCADKPFAAPAFPARLAARIAKGFGVCLLAPWGVEPRLVKKLRLDLAAIGGAIDGD